MADVSKIKTPDGTSYDLADQECRANLNNLNGSLATVARTGSYADLTNKPTVAVIDDSSTAADKAWSASKIDTELGDKANSSHTHTISQVSWPQAQNLSCTATAANQEYSIDLPSNQTGCYFHVWSGKNSKTILKCDNDTNNVAIENGALIVNGTKGGSWSSSKDVNQASISVNDKATNGLRYDSIIAEKCYNNGVISIGRITNELHIGYVESGRTTNSLAKSLAFKPADDKVSFITDGAEKSYIRLSDGYYSGKAENSVKWNGVTDDHSTNNTSDTWVPVYSNNVLQHRVIPVAYNTAPLNISSVHALPSFSGTAIPSTQYLAYWNGAYGGGTNSNLKYTAVGSLKATATKDWLTSMDGASSSADGTRILASNPNGTGIMGSFLRASFSDWSSSFTVACKGSAGAMGHVTICTGGTSPSWCEYSIQKGGSNAAWTWLYNSTYKDTGKSISSGITVSTSTQTYNNVTYNLITFTATSQKKWFACWGVSDNTSG